MFPPRRHVKIAALIARALAITVLCSSGAALRLGYAAQKTIVVLGSSTAEGVGASSYAQSWSGLLAASLAPRGWRVQNVSISGTGTAASLARFDRDVTPYQPGFVMLATSIINDGILVTPDAAVAAYVSNTRALIRKVESIHAIPVLVLPYPHDSFTASMYSSIRAIYDQLESEGVPVLDFLDGTDDGRGHWISGAQVDGTHPNDTGHRLLFESIPPMLFDALLLPAAPAKLQAFGSLVEGADLSRESYIAVRPATAMPSWTASFWTMPSGDAAGRTLLSVSGPALQIRRAAGEWSLWSASTLLCKVSAGANAAFDHVALTFQSATGRLRFYIDSVLQLETTILGAAPAEAFSLGGVAGNPEWNAAGDGFSSLAVYRAPLSATGIQQLSAGRAPWRSIEAWLPLSYSPYRAYVNLAPGIPVVDVVGNWTWSSSGARQSFFSGAPRTNAHSGR